MIFWLEARPASSPPRAFSSEVAAGWREENASKQRNRASFRFRRNGKGSKRRAATALIAFGIAAICTAAFTSSPAGAQYYGGRGGYYDGPDGPGPMGPEGPMYPDGPYDGYDGPQRPYQRPAPQRPVQPRPPAAAEQHEDHAPTILSLADIRDRITQRGFHLIATPRRKGRIYLAAGEDAKGVRHRLVFDAYDGHLIENMVIGSKTPAAKSGHGSDSAEH